MKRSYAPIIVTAIIVILAGSLIGILLYLRGQTPDTRGVAPIVEISPMEPDSSKWGINFPNQYATLLKTETNNTRTTYGGSEPFSHLENDPRLLTLFAGYSFSKEYNDDRGHWNSLTDVRAIARVNETTTGTCYSCKSSNNPSLWEQMGMAEFDKQPFAEIGAHLTNPIGCANCHEANTMRLIVTNPALEEALIAQGLDWTTFTRQEMRSVVCANCHVEYYFEGPGKYLVLPWANGRNIEQIAAYYEAEQFTDWTHPDSGAAMVKMQHPDFEIYAANSTHYNAGVACAGDRLHGDDEDLAQPETVKKGFEGDRQTGDGAVGVGYNAATPAPLAALALDQARVFRVDLRQDERHILRCAIGGGVGADRNAAAGEERLDGFGSGCRQSGESQARRHTFGRVGQHGHLSRPGRHGGGQDPVTGMRIALSYGAFRPGEGDDLEPPVPVQKLHEALSHHHRPAGRILTQPGGEDATLLAPYP